MINPLTINPLLINPLIITDGVAGASLLVGIFALLVSWLQGRARARDKREMAGIQTSLQESLQKSLREEAERGRVQCQGEIAGVRETIAEAEKNAQANLESLRDGRLGMPARARALRMLRSGMSAETAAVELGLARNEVQLLEKVSILLAPQN
jgi:hypothetical protein